MTYCEIKNIPIVMIIGAPRSGTTILGSILDHHPSISTWIEPYYIWDHYFREAPHDERDASDANAEVQGWIRNAFSKYRKNLKVDRVVDKSPRNCLKLPFVQRIFPEAHYIFLLRDGRDTILSILRQWEIQKRIFAKNKGSSQWHNRIRILSRWLGRRPTLKFRLQSILFELGPPSTWLQGKFLKDIRWDGKFGWGPRFKDWQSYIDRVSPLEFSAYQWNSCASGILDNISLIPEHRRFILKYEDFIRDPEASITSLFSFLKIDLPDGYMEALPQIWADNSNKWRQAFSSTELKLIGPIICKTMREIGYENDESWYIDLNS